MKQTRNLAENNLFGGLRVKISGSSMSRGNDLLAAASVIWDTQGDARRQDVEVAVTLTPGEIDRAVVMDPISICQA